MSEPIFDTHIHISNFLQPIDGRVYPVKTCLSDMKQYNFSGAIVMPDPIDPEIFAFSRNRVHFTDDGKYFFSTATSFENDTEFSSAKNNKQDLDHILRTKQLTDVGELPENYWLSINQQLISSCKNNKSLFPYVLLPVNPELANQTILSLEQENYGEFFGLKFHPNSYSFPMYDTLLQSFEQTGRKLDYPVIIHTGINDFDHPINAINFAKNYSGNVCLAHCARFDEQTLAEIAKLNNVYIDISPSYYLTTVSKGANEKVFNKDQLSSLSPTELLIKLINTVGEDKILAGSDAPYGSIAQLRELKESLDISPDLSKKIFNSNAQAFNNKAYMQTMSDEELKSEYNNLSNSVNLKEFSPVEQ